MLGFDSFATSSFGSLPDIAEVIDGEAIILSTASLEVTGGYNRYGSANIYSIATLTAEGVDQNGGRASIKAEAIMSVYANERAVGVAFIKGVATLVSKGGITGEGWVRVQPDKDEWDFKESSDWTKIS